MRFRISTIMVASVGFAALAAQVSSAQTPPPGPGGAQKSFSQEAPASAVAPSDPRDLSSVWTYRNRGPESKAGYRAGITPPPAPPPPGTDLPDPGQLCVPGRFFGGGTYPTQFIQSPGQVTMIQEENHRIRRIYLDRPQPASAPLTYGGHSVGRWEGDTLVIDTRFFRPSKVRPLPADAVVTERIRKVAGGRQLEWQVTTTSASTYDKPPVETLYLNWRPDLHIQEQICEENSDVYGDSYWNKDGGK